VEEGVIARALIHHWPPNSWGRLTVPQLCRIYAVERKMADEREEARREQQPTAPPMRGNGSDNGSDTAYDDDDDDE
jgi:hypothetical protein